MAWYTRAWKAVPETANVHSAHTIPVSVLIPARNEAQRIRPLLTSLDQQDYPEQLTEIIVIDDHSTDETAAVVQQFSFVKLIQLREDSINAYKKKAIETGVAAASGTLIICTDADCIPGPRWISSIVTAWEKNKPAFIAAPVKYRSGKKLFEQFQALDFLVLQGITGAAVHSGAHAMSNGANLAYTREAFYAVNGFEGINQIASGDDMLLMQKMADRFPGSIIYLKAKDAIVETEPMPDLRSFMHQRIRWASKATYYTDKKIFAVLLLVYLYNLHFAALVIAAFFNPLFVYWLAAGILLKTIIEFPFVYTVSRFFKQQQLLGWFPLFQPLHILYTIVSGLLGQAGKYEWKGRTVK